MISGGVTAFFAIWIRSWGGIIACFLSGIFIDFDHHLDYWLLNKELPINYKKLVDFFENQRMSHVMIFFHSYEVLSLMWVCVFLFDLNVIWLGIAVGCTTHVLCDEIFNPIKPMAYFLTYRIVNRFQRNHFFKKKFHID